ncbi:MAG: hypothetical protein ACI92I_000343 [Acidimicrobiales bacterium]|jgi:hypothetical protein
MPLSSFQSHRFFIHTLIGMAGALLLTVVTLVAVIMSGYYPFSDKNIVTPIEVVDVTPSDTISEPEVAHEVEYVLPEGETFTLNYQTSPEDALEYLDALGDEPYQYYVIPLPTDLMTEDTPALLNKVINSAAEVSLMMQRDISRAMLNVQQTAVAGDFDSLRDRMDDAQGEIDVIRSYIEYSFSTLKEYEVAMSNQSHPAELQAANVVFMDATAETMDQTKELLLVFEGTLEMKPVEQDVITEAENKAEALAQQYGKYSEAVAVFTRAIFDAR